MVYGGWLMAATNNQQRATNNRSLDVRFLIFPVPLTHVPPGRITGCWLLAAGGWLPAAAH
jgi:hypothetical protein